MSSFIDRLKQGRLWDFPGGVFPEQFKALSNQVDIADIPLPSVLYVPIKQHIGVEGKLNVAKGDKVLKGQALTQSSHPFAVPVHAPTSGTVINIVDHVSAHPSGFTEPTVVIEPDGLEKWTPLAPPKDYKSLPKVEVVEKLCQAGISGMGGAGFPTHIKLSSDKQISTLIINGIECEPYISSDDRLMREHAWQIRQGIDVLCHLLNPQHVIIAIEDNKPEAISAMEVACQDAEQYVMCHVPTKYPAGGEKQLIQVLTGEEVPQDGLPIDLGILMHNVGTCFAIADAIFAGKPLIQRVVTLTGKALNAPTNVWALLGTPVAHLLQVAEYQSQQQRQQRVIMGGPMMGFTVASDQVPVVKITNCLLVPTDKEIPLPQDEMPCIRCGACADACPAGLLPQQLYWHSKAGELEQAQAFNIADCIECGACAYVCPSSIPLVHYYRQTKADIRIADEQKRKAEQAKERFNARQERLDREKQEREAKRKIGTSRRNNVRQSVSAENQSTANDDSQAKTTTGKETSNNANKVAAAIARAKAKKAQAEKADAISDTQAEITADTASSTETVKTTDASIANNAEPDANKARVAAAIARAKAKKAQAQQANAPSDTNTGEAASAARDQASSTETPTTDDAAIASAPEPDSNKARVAAAIARAKAKKAQAQQMREQEDSVAQRNHSPDITATKIPAQEVPMADSAVASSAPSKASNSQSIENTLPIEDQAQQASIEDAEQAKQARIAEAIARAKARKKQKTSKPKSENPTATPSVVSSDAASADDIEAERTKRVEAAIAKAKARQQERRQANKSGPKSADKNSITGES